jgi:L-ascorbate metabolism protein UlaG (beta-lactamase superfamily)
MSETIELNTRQGESPGRHPGAAVTWLGHATTLIEVDGARVVTDPVLSGHIGPLVRVAPRPHDEDVAELDAILLSHLHYDHTDLPSLARLDPSTPVLAPRGAGRWLEDQGLRRVRELEVGTEATVGPLRVTATHASHDGRRRPLGAVAEAIGFVVRGSRSAYFAGDTDLFPAMADLAGSVDVALLPVSGWGPTLPEGHLDPKRAAIAATLTAPRLAIPIHWGTFALWPTRAFRRRDPGRRAREFAELVSRHAPAVEVRVLAPGDRTEIPALAAATAR